MAVHWLLREVAMQWTVDPSIAGTNLHLTWVEKTLETLQKYE